MRANSLEGTLWHKLGDGRSSLHFFPTRICDRIRRALNVRIEIALHGIAQIAVEEITTINSNADAVYDFAGHTLTRAARRAISTAKRAFHRSAIKALTRAT